MTRDVPSNLSGRQTPLECGPMQAVPAPRIALYRPPRRCWRWRGLQPARANPLPLPTPARNRASLRICAAARSPYRSPSLSRIPAPKPDPPGCLASGTPIRCACPPEARTSGALGLHVAAAMSAPFSRAEE
jgi:hypothetical protein